MGMGTGEEEGKGGVGVGADRTGQEEDQAGRIIERLRKLKAGAEERQQAYSTMEHYFEELGKKLPNDEIQRSFANAISDLAGGLEELYGVVNILTEMVTEESIRRQQQQLQQP
jgi:K+-sensing histidine kinase KdpD